MAPIFPVTAPPAQQAPPHKEPPANEKEQDASTIASTQESFHPMANVLLDTTAFSAGKVFDIKAKGIKLMSLPHHDRELEINVQSKPSDAAFIVTI
jgi:hypothetical protein